MKSCNDPAQLDRFTRVIPLHGPGQTQPRSHQVAGAGACGIAGLADGIVQLVLFSGLAWLVMEFRPHLFPRSAWFWAVPVSLLEFHVIYHMLCEAFTRGSSPGKAFAGIKVVSIDGSRPGGVALVIRNLCRIPDLVLSGYALSFFLMYNTRLHQGLGDLAARTTTCYRVPLRHQLAKSMVPESLYSTSEDGYLLEAWIMRSRRLDAESQPASALDLAAYLHSKYDPAARELPEPSVYLAQLYAAELEQYSSPDSSQNAQINDQNTSAAIGSE